MVSGFRHSLSFPTTSDNRSSTTALVEKSRRHIRSTSLPCRFHPLVSQLNDAVSAIRRWESEHVRSLPWAVDGLVLLDHVHDSFFNLLNLTQSHNTLRSGGTGWTDTLLDGFLRLADAHGTFRFAVMELRQHHSAIQAAIRGRDEAHLSSCLRSQRRAEKELFRLVSAVRDATRSPATALPADGSAEVAELAGIMREVTAVTAIASAAVFSCVAAASATTSVRAPRWSRFWCKEGDQRPRWSVFEKLEALEAGMRGLEEKSARVFRNLVNMRVSLLNILTPSM